QARDDLTAVGLRAGPPGGLVGRDAVLLAEFVNVETADAVGRGGPLPARGFAQDLGRVRRVQGVADPREVARRRVPGPAGAGAGRLRVVLGPGAATGRAGAGGGVG